MIKQIDSSNKIFQSDIYKKDEYLFSEVLNENVQIISNEEDYIVFYDDENNKIWVWSKDKINKKVFEEIEQIIWECLLQEKNSRIICKENLYRMLLKDDLILLNLEDYNETNFYKPNNKKNLKPCDGDVYIPNIYDIDKISRYYYENCLESTDIIITFRQVKKYIYSLIVQNNKNLYTWKNNQNEIVSLLILTENEKYALISNLFAPHVYRNNGYSSNLLYKITQIVKSSNLEPIVISNGNDEKYLEKVGYIKNGILVSSSCSLENKKNKYY